MPNLEGIKCSTGNQFLCISCSTEPCSGGRLWLMGSVIVLSKINLNYLKEKKSSLSLSHVFSTRTSVCIWINSTLSWLPWISFLQIQSHPCDLATFMGMTSEEQWGFVMVMLTPADLQPWTCLCCLKGSLTRSSWAPRVSRATCHAGAYRLLIPGLLINYWSSYLPQTGAYKEGNEWKRFFFLNGCLQVRTVLLYVFIPCD